MGLLLTAVLTIGSVTGNWTMVYEHAAEPQVVETMEKSQVLDGKMEVLFTPAPLSTQIPESYHFIVEDGVLTQYNGYGGKITIPDEVTRIGEGVFEESTNIVSVTFPDGLTYIGESAFKGCSLEEINIPKTVTGVGAFAFAECSALTHIQIPGNVLEIGKQAFYECSALQGVTFEEGLLEIGQYAFWGCESLDEVLLPSSLETLGEKAFAKNTLVEKASVEKKIMSGDVNGDGDVTLEDAQLTLKAALKIMDLDEDATKAADISGDGQIDLEDAQNILLAALKIKSLDYEVSQ